MIELKDILFNEAGLIPVVIRDRAARAILMLAWMNQESFQRTIDSGEVWLWSRSRAVLWNKGATSGNHQRVVSMAIDCDGDALLVDVDPAGPACHTGAYSCFGDEAAGDLRLDGLMSTLRDRQVEMPSGSYSASLFSTGVDQILKKIGEESAEVIIAVKGESRERVVSEITDLLFHLAVLMVDQKIDVGEINRELASREEKGRTGGVLSQS